MKIISLILLLLLSAIGVYSQNNKPIDTHTRDSCQYHLRMLLNSTNIDKNRLEKFKVSIDGVEGRVLIVKIYNTNEVNIDVPIAWVEIDLIKTELRDITFDSDNPTVLSFDRKLLNKFIDACKTN